MSQNGNSSDKPGVTEHSAGQPCADAATIGKDITQALHRSKSFPETIGVEVDGSKIKLTGAVLSLQDRKTAEATALAEPGATNLKCEINIP